MKKYLSGLVLVTIVLLVCLNYSCEKNANEDLLGKWIFFSVEVVNGKNPILYPDSIDKKITIVFTDSSIALNGYCNMGSGYYQIDGDKINFENLWMTERGCLMNGWENYLFSICEANSYALDQDYLKLYTDGDIRVLNFLKAE